MNTIRSRFQGPQPRSTPMFKKVVTIASVTALLATATVPAFAHDRGYRGGHHGGGGNGAAVALGVLGAFAVGAAILSATHPAPPPVAYAPAPAYYPPPAYYAPQPQAYYGPQAYYAPQPQAYYPPQSYESYAYDGSSHPWEPV